LFLRSITVVDRFPGISFQNFQNKYTHRNIVGKILFVVLKGICPISVSTEIFASLQSIFTSLVNETCFALHEVNIYLLVLVWWQHVKFSVSNDMEGFFTSFLTKMILY